jgi:hypothetical protein
MSGLAAVKRVTDENSGKSRLISEGRNKPLIMGSGVIPIC